MANWYGIYTRPRWEKKVSEALSKRKIECYCPMSKVSGGWGDKRKQVYEPLFSSFVFVRLNPMQIEEIKKLDGIINMVYWLGKPAVFRDIEIEMMKRFLNEHKRVRLEKTKVNVREIVKIINEPSKESFSAADDILLLKTVKLMLPTLGYLIVADVEVEQEEIPMYKGIRTFEAPMLKTV